MNTELTVQHLDAKIDHLSDKIDNLAVTVQSLSGTVQDVLETLNIFATNVDKRFDEMHADFGAVSRKGNTKLTVLVDSLVSEKTLDSRTAQRILALEPYPQG